MTEAEQEPPLHYLDWSVKGKSAIWRYVLAIITAFLLWILGGIPAAILFPSAVTNPALSGVALPWSFIVGFVVVLLLARFLLGRPATSLFAAGRPIPWRDYLIGVLIGYGIAILLSLLSTPFSPMSYQGFGKEIELGGWLILFTLVGFVIQTGFEELFFRGLIMQFLCRLKLWLPLVIAIQAVVFSIPHFGNVPSMSGLGYISVLPYFMIAAAWGWVGWRTGSLLMSMGLHFANNTLGVFVVGNKGDVLTPYGPLLQEAPTFTGAMIGIAGQVILTVVAVEFWMRRREKAAAKAAA